MLLATWGVIALLLLTRLAWRHVRLARMLRGRQHVTDPTVLAMLAELRRMAGVWVPVGLTSTRALGSPLVYGRREICVPERFLTELGAGEQRAALAHELAHLARRDPAWLLGTMVLECVFFFQPLQRIARLRLRETMEYRADGWAVRVAGGQLSLARCLAEVARWVAPAGPVVAEQVAMAEGGSPLLSRVRRLLEREPEPEPRAAARIAAAVALVAAAAVLAPAVSASDPIADHDAASTVQQSLDPQDPIDLRRMDGDTREGSSFVARLNEAGRDAAGRTYWVAYVTSTRARQDPLVEDSGGWDTRILSQPGVAARLGIGPSELDVRGGRPVIVLARLAPDGPVTVVERIALRDPSVGIDLAGRVYWLGAAEAEESFRWLRDIFNAVDDKDIRDTVIEVIALHSISGAEDFLWRVIETESDSRLRANAVEGLEHHPSDRTVALLLDLAQRDRDERVAGEATETLGDIDHPAASGALRTIMDSGSSKIRREALETLVEHGDTALAALLLRIALQDPDRVMRLEAVEHMEELPPDVAVPLLQRVTNESSDVEVAAQAAETLAEIGSADAIEALTNIAAKHSSTRVRRAAIEHLVEMESRWHGSDLLVQIALTDPDRDVRREAAESLEELPAEEALPLLRRIVFESTDAEVQREAAQSIGELGTQAALEALTDIVSNVTRESVVFEALDGIASEFTKDQAVPILTRVSRDHPNVRVRREALDHLVDLEGGP